MKVKYKIAYHTSFWLIRIIHSLTFNYYLWNIKWYIGTYWVNLILIPFFYFNYAVLTPLLLKKKYIRYSLIFSVWSASFIIIYSAWTMYRGKWMYNKSVIEPQITEAINNIILLWIISTGFYLFELWYDTMVKNRELDKQNKLLELKQQRNKLLPNLVNRVLTEMKQQRVNEIPDKVVMLADLLKYVLYQSEKKISLETEISFLTIYNQLQNFNSERLLLSGDNSIHKILIYPAEIILVVDKLIGMVNSENNIPVKIETTSDSYRLRIAIADTSVLKKASEELKANNYHVAYESNELIIHPGI